eukprot:1155949-Pelagomonas_calceolata.AAC.2
MRAVQLRLEGHSAKVALQQDVEIITGMNSTHSRPIPFVTSMYALVHATSVVPAQRHTALQLAHPLMLVPILNQQGESIATGLAIRQAPAGMLEGSPASLLGIFSGRKNLPATSAPSMEVITCVPATSLCMHERHYVPACLLTEHVHLDSHGSLRIEHELPGSTPHFHT